MTEGKPFEETLARLVTFFQKRRIPHALIGGRARRPIPSTATTVAAIVILTAVYFWQRRRAGAVLRHDAAATVRPG